MTEPTSTPDKPPEPRPPSPLAIGIAFLIIYFSWGTTYYATSVAMKWEKMPPALFGGVRIFLAGCILLLWQLTCGQSLRITWGEFARLLLVSMFLFLAGNLLINLGQREVESGVAAILIATTPLWMGLFGLCLPHGERLSWLGWLGLFIGFAGILMTMMPQLKNGFALGDDYHPFLILGSAMSWAAGSLASRHLAVKIPHLTSAGYQMLLGGLCQVMLGTALGEWQTLPDRLSDRAIGTFLYLLVVGSLTGFVAFNWLLGHVPAAKVGTYAYVNPVIAVLIGWYFKETVIHLLLILGIAVILVGVYLVRGDHRPAQEIVIEPD